METRYLTTSPTLISYIQLIHEITTIDSISIDLTLPFSSIDDLEIHDHEITTIDSISIDLTLPFSSIDDLEIHDHEITTIDSISIDLTLPLSSIDDVEIENINVIVNQSVSNKKKKKKNKSSKSNKSKRTVKNNQYILKSVFLEKLCTILDNPEYNNIISWSDDGCSIIIHNKDNILEVLNTCYNMTSHNSFIRQLNYFAFEKINNENIYHNSLFNRDNRKLMNYIKRRTYSI
jgi:hypothetical protein